jgi:hypothetical protein
MGFGPRHERHELIVPLPGPDGFIKIGNRLC